MDVLDIEWFKHQEGIEKSYDIFYKTQVSSVWISILYVIKGEVIFVNREKCQICDRLLRREDIIGCISKNHKNNYKIDSISKFNYTISPEQIVNSDYVDNYFCTINHLQDIIFNDTISYFTDLNELFIILKPSHECAASATKKTKNLCFKKTRRKQL